MAQSVAGKNKRDRKKVEELAAEYVDIETVFPSPQNVELRDNAEAIPVVAKSIERFGFGAPIVARRANRQIIAGHTRHEAAKTLGIARVPVRFLDISQDEADLLALADNRTGEKATWREAGLKAAAERFGLDAMAIAGWAETELPGWRQAPKEKKPRAPRIADGKWTVIRADLRTEREEIDIDDESFDAVLCDPPYELGFMGKRWDATGIAFDADMWKWIASKLRPGAPVLAFGGTRTYHRMTCAIEDAGFEVRDCLTWLYGSGFPKSHDVSKSIDKANGHHRGQAGKVESSNVAMGGPNYARTDKGEPITDDAQAWDGYGTALKPAWEPCVLARKPLEGTILENVKKHGVGALGIDRARIGDEQFTAHGGGVGEGVISFQLSRDAGLRTSSSTKIPPRYSTRKPATDRA